MSAIRISEAVLRDKIMGCWMGKNAGGTLGTPLEKMWGEREPFNIDFYPRLAEGGIPNDDLEIQLIWLQALEERGLDLTCRDLAEYWLDCIQYNPDEYGLHKTNLRQGLTPPVSGAYNNHFRDCMGCPIRSEIWACIAPGLPAVAAHYAWHDAVVDHARGESVHGEVFNAIVESAAFFVSDRDALLDLALAAIPESCATSRAIRHARQVKREGMDWLAARNSVMELAYHPNAQHSPINLGFQTVGWLYGADFGDALCKAVNCGWDTDCTGATLGAILGIVDGAKALPQRWIAPLGDTIATNEIHGLLTHLRVPKTLDELTDRVMAVTRQIAEKHRDRVIITHDSEPADGPQSFVLDPAELAPIYARRQDEVEFPTSSALLKVAVPEGPGVAAGRTTPVEVAVVNRTPRLFEAAFAIDLPEGFEVEDLEPFGEFAVEPGEEWRFRLGVRPAAAEDVLTTNVGWLRVMPTARSQIVTAPIVLMGARRFLVSNVQPGAKLDDADQPILDTIEPGQPTRGWREADFTGNELVVEPDFDGAPGVVWLQHYIYVPTDRRARLGVPNSGRMRLWLDGAGVHETQKIVPLRPSYWGDESNYTDLDLAEGWHHLVIKLERGASPLLAHFVASELPLMHGMEDLGQTRFIWEAGELAEEPKGWAG